MGPVCAGGGSEEVALPRPEWKGKALYFRLLHSALTPGAARGLVAPRGRTRIPAAEAAAEDTGHARAQPAFPARGAPRGWAGPRWGGGGSCEAAAGALRTCAGQAGLFGGGAMQTSSRANALLKGSRPELRRACARVTRFA